MIGRRSPPAVYKTLTAVETDYSGNFQPKTSDNTSCLEIT